MVAVSASMIIRDEADLLPQALESLKRSACIDEIVVVDTGSTDGSQDIARAHGAVVHQDEWRNDFSYHRNQCLDLCQNDWVFILDGDEVLTSAGNLDEIFAAPPSNAITVRVECVRDEQVFEGLQAVRAFNRQHARWKYAIHNQVVGIEVAHASSATIRAIYDDSAIDNCIQRMGILLEGAKADPSDPHYPYFIAKAYRNLRQPDEVIRWGEKFRALAPESPQNALVSAWIVEGHFFAGRPDEAVACLEAAVAKYPRFPDLQHMRLTLTALDWLATITEPDPNLLTVPSSKSSFAKNFQQAAALLGLPVEMS